MTVRRHWWSCFISAKAWLGIRKKRFRAARATGKRSSCSSPPSASETSTSPSSTVTGRRRTRSCRTTRKSCAIPTTKRPTSASTFAARSSASPDSSVEKNLHSYFTVKNTCQFNYSSSLHKNYQTTIEHLHLYLYICEIKLLYFITFILSYCNIADMLQVQPASFPISFRFSSNYKSKNMQFKWYKKTTKLTQVTWLIMIENKLHPI